MDYFSKKRLLMKKSLADFLLGLQDWEETGMDADPMFRLCSQNIGNFLSGESPSNPVLLISCRLNFKFIPISNYCFYVILVAGILFYLLAYLKNSVFHGVEITICFFMPNCFINLLFSKSHPWIRI